MANKKKSRQPAEPVLLKKLRKHFSCDPGKLPVVGQEFSTYERPNLHLAIEQILSEKGRRSELVGVVVCEEYRSVTLPKLARRLTTRECDEGPAGCRAARCCC